MAEEEEARRPTYADLTKVVAPENVRMIILMYGGGRGEEKEEYIVCCF